MLRAKQVVSSRMPRTIPCGAWKNHTIDQIKLRKQAIAAIATPHCNSIAAASPEKVAAKNSKAELPPNEKVPRGQASISVYLPRPPFLPVPVEPPNRAAGTSPEPFSPREKVAEGRMRERRHGAPQQPEDALSRVILARIGQVRKLPGQLFQEPHVDTDVIPELVERTYLTMFICMNCVPSLLDVLKPRVPFTHITR